MHETNNDLLRLLGLKNITLPTDASLTEMYKTHLENLKQSKNLKISELETLEELIKKQL